MYLQGTYKQFTQQYGTVTAKWGEEYFISRFDTNGAFSLDTVNIRVLKDAENGKKSEATIIKIIRRTEEPIVCICKKKYKTNEIIILPYRIHQANPIKIVGRASNLRSGDILSVKIISGVDKLVGSIVQIIGNERQRDIEEKIVLIQNNILLRFPEAVEKAAKKLHLPEKPQKRLDLRKLLTVTIDGEDAKDLDDAISVTRLKNGNFELWVHIADVAEYVQENDQIDIEALRRGTSIYLPDMVIPMLPEELSNNLCSLHPGTPKLTLSIRMELDDRGQVIDRSIHETIIESNYRLTYNYVAEIIEASGDARNTPSELNQLVKDAYELKQILDIRRAAEWKIDFDLPEIQIIMGKNSEVITVKKRERNEAHKLIEEFMVLANEEISKYFSIKKIPFLYRIHEVPSELALKKLSQIAGQYGHSFNPEKPKPKDIQMFLDSIKKRPYEYHIARLTLQSMARAQYSDLLLGHYGLALYYYSHFTSPIRRYPDLQIHRIIKEHLRWELTEARIGHYNAKLKSIAISCSNTERQAEGIERTIKDLKIIEFMERNIGKEYLWMISFINENGCTVELKNGIEWFIHESQYPYNYIFDAEKQILNTKKPGKTLYIWKPISIVVTEADKKSRRLHFTFADNV